MKRILLVSLILALVLSLVLPSVAMAAKPASFSASGILTSIDTGTVKQLGNSDMWLVKDRHITGNFETGDLGAEAFTITYGGVFSLTTQAGPLKGVLTLDNKPVELSIVGAVKPLTMVDMGGYALPKLTIKGIWADIKGIKASGSFTAYMIFIPDAQGHVLAIVDSAFDMTGKYSKK